jgi:hypothetical protein
VTGLSASAGSPGASQSARTKATGDNTLLWLSIVVDEACGQIWDAAGSGAAVTALRVSPDVYQAVAAARPGEVARGFPLMLLGLPLIADGAVATYHPVVVRSAGFNSLNGSNGSNGSDGRVRS